MNIVVCYKISCVFTCRHTACWAGHVDATLALLKAGDARDLYVHDFDVRHHSGRRYKAIYFLRVLIYYELYCENA